MLRLVFLLSVCYNLSAGTGYSYVYAGLISLSLLSQIKIKTSIILLFFAFILFGFSLLNLEGVFILFGFTGIAFLRFRSPPYRFMLNSLLCITIISVISGYTNQSGLLQGIYFKPNNFAVAVSAGSLVLVRLLHKENTSLGRLYIYGIVFVVAAILSGSRIAIVVAALPFLRLCKERPLYLMIILIALITFYYQGLFDAIVGKLDRRAVFMEDERFYIWTEVINRLELIKYTDLSGLEKGLHNTFLFLLTSLGGILGSILSVILIIKLYGLSRLFGLGLMVILLIYLNVEVIAYKELWITVVYFIAEFNYKKRHGKVKQMAIVYP